MHRLENLLVAIELKCVLAAAFPAADEVSANRVGALSCTLNFSHILVLFMPLIALNFLIRFLKHSPLRSARNAFPWKGLKYLVTLSLNLQ